MGRPHRLEYAGAYHHVMNRGGGRRDIFIDDRDKRRFLHFVEEAHERFEFEVHAFCLMSNHFHLLTRTPQANVGEAMHHITSCYASWSNHRRQTDGSLFRGRYLARHVDEDNYLLHVSRYIHLNPVEARIVEAASEYRWSSMKSYLGLTPRPRWLFMGQVLRTIGGTSPRRRYAEFVADGDGTEDPAWYVEDRAADVEPTSRDDAEPSALVAIDNAVAKQFQVEPADLLRGKRGQRNVARMVAVGLSREMTNSSLRALATHYGFGTPSGIHAATTHLRAELKAGGDETLRCAVSMIRADLVEY